MTDERYEKAMSLVTGVLDYEHFKDVDLVIEASLYPCFPHKTLLAQLSLFTCFSRLQAVIENVKLKQQIFSDLDNYCPSHCILATNTSTIDLNRIGEKTMSQDRIVGAHFFR